MDDLLLARALHVVGVVIWIGGVAMVTSVLLPLLIQMPSAQDRTEFFRKFEKRFAAQARIATLVVGLSGFYMVHVLHAWSRFGELRYWWMHAMVFVWLLFSVLLFILEPNVLRRRVETSVQQASEATFRKMQRFHWILLSISLVTVAGAVAGSHGWLMF